MRDGVGGGICSTERSVLPWAPPAGARREAIIHVTNKVDLGGTVPEGAIGVSALTGQGLDDLRVRLAEAARSLTESAGPPPLTQARHRAALQEAAARLADAGIADCQSCGRRICVSRYGHSGESPAASAWRTSSTRCSPGSASASSYCP